MLRSDLELDLSQADAGEQFCAKSHQVWLVQLEPFVHPLGLISSKYQLFVGVHPIISFASAALRFGTLFRSHAIPSV
jgi:hypothetical protein